MTTHDDIALPPVEVRTEVLIVGAGPTGLMLALCLAQRGVACHIIDASPTPAPEPRAIGMQARTLELLASLGIVAPFLVRGDKRTLVKIFIDGKLRIRNDYTGVKRPDTPFPFLLVVPQNVTEQILGEALVARGVSIQRPARIGKLEVGFTSVTTEVARGNSRYTVRSRYIVGCDGANSSVRQLASFDWRGSTSPGEFIQGDLHVEGLTPAQRGDVSIFVGKGSVAGFFPLPIDGVDRVSVTRSLETDLPGHDRGPTTVAELQERFNEVTGWNVRLSEPIWLTRYRLQHRSTPNLRKGNVFLAGDAAHAHSPIGGQGMNTGIQDGANLAWKLVEVLQRRAPAALLDTYEAERWPVSQRLIRFTGTGFSLFITRNPVLLAMRRLLAPLGTLVSNIPALARKRFAEQSQLAIRYPAGGLAAQDDLSADAPKILRQTVPPGARAPNAFLRDGSELFDLLTGYRFHAVVLTRAAFDAESLEAVRRLCRTRWPEARLHIIVDDARLDLPGHVHATSDEVFERYGVTNRALFLIRPDGYVGYRSDLADLAPAHGGCSGERLAA